VHTSAVISHTETLYKFNTNLLMQQSYEFWKMRNLNFQIGYNSAKLRYKNPKRINRAKLAQNLKFRFSSGSSSLHIYKIFIHQVARARLARFLFSFRLSSNQTFSISAWRPGTCSTAPATADRPCCYLYLSRS
jgi:hypothetical protein